MMDKYNISENHPLIKTLDKSMSPLPEDRFQTPEEFAQAYKKAVSIL